VNPSSVAAAPAPAELDLGPSPSMFDLVLRGQRRLSALLVDEVRLPGSILRMIGLSVAGLAVHGLVVGLAARGLGSSHDFFSRGTPWMWIPLSLVGAFMGALCVCLPSFYFYTQLSGLDASFRLVTAQALRAQATTSVLLLGALPFYAAWVLGILAAGSSRQTNVFLDPALATLIGLALPFMVGLFGVREVYRGFKDLAQVLPMTHARRGNFLGRMVLAWGGVFTAVSTVALWRLADALGRAL
jgi:hypothetical protein